jgi:hypothetical protein
MAAPSLLDMRDSGFAFEHVMAHRLYLGVMSPLTRFSVIPYFIDPMTAKRPADGWHLNHQQAHNDALNNLPAQYLGDIAAGVGSDLADTNLDNPASRSWWTFFNRIEHYVGSNTILPQPVTPPPPPSPTFTYPFW